VAIPLGVNDLLIVDRINKNRVSALRHGHHPALVKRGRRASHIVKAICSQAGWLLRQSGPDVAQMQMRST
jgi:hypothetical protein